MELQMKKLTIDLIDTFFDYLEHSCDIICRNRN